MEQMIDQTLQQAVAAHKAGDLQEAEKLYRAILNTQTDHPDANHNLGILAISVGKAEEALPHFKKALEANPNIEQFWVSYIDGLARMGQITEAQRLLNRGLSLLTETMTSIGCIQMNENCHRFKTRYFT